MRQSNAQRAPLRTTRPVMAAAAALATAVAAMTVAPSPALALQVPPPAAPPGSAPAGTSTAPAGAVQLEAVVIGVKGTVQVRAAEDKPWEPAAVGMKLGQGADVRTGLRSAVQLKVEPDQTITLDRLGTVKVLQAFQAQGKVTTDIGMKYGRTQFDIQKTDLEHASTIRSPGSTLALRGTNIVYEDQAPWVPSAVSREGRAEFRNLRRELVAFGGTKRAVVSGDTRGPAQKALTSTRIDSRTAFSGRTDSEDQLLLGLSSTGGLDAQGYQAVQELARLGGFTGNFIGVPPVPGPLEFRLDWIQTNPTAILPANLDLLVTDPQGRTATFQTPTIGTGSSIGMHTGDDQGLRGVGAESVVWGLFFPAGRYTVTAVNRAGADSQIFLSITQGQAGNPVASFGIDPEPAIVLKEGETFSATVRPVVGAATGGSGGSTVTASPSAAKAGATATATAGGTAGGTGRSLPPTAFARPTTPMPAVARPAVSPPVFSPPAARFPQSLSGPREARPQAGR